MLGVDSSEGIQGGDPAAACIIRMRDAALVGVMAGYVSPPEWGRKCARLAWYFNEAMLAFETFPSAHGLSAARTALAYGYPRLYQRVTRTTATPDRTELLGWHTDARTKEMMIDRVREALAEKSEIPCLDVLRQIRKLRYNESHKLETAEGEHDDLFVALAIALMVRDEAFARGAVRQEKKRARSFEEIELERYEAELDEPKTNDREAFYDGV